MSYEGGERFYSLHGSFLNAHIQRREDARSFFTNSVTFRRIADRNSLDVGVAVITTLRWWSVSVDGRAHHYLVFPIFLPEGRVGK